MFYQMILLSPPPLPPSSLLPVFLISFPPIIMLPSLSHPPRLSPCQGASMPVCVRKDTCICACACACVLGGGVRARKFAWAMQRWKPMRRHAVINCMPVSIMKRRRPVCMHARDAACSRNLGLSANLSVVRHVASGERWNERRILTGFVMQHLSIYTWTLTHSRAPLPAPAPAPAPAPIHERETHRNVHTAPRGSRAPIPK